MKLKETINELTDKVKRFLVKNEQIGEENTKAILVELSTESQKVDFLETMSTASNLKMICGS